MPHKSLDVFVNPAAGRGRATRRAREIREILEGAGLDITVHESEGQGDLEDRVLAFVREGGQRLVVAGGDGSVHEAVNGMLSAGGHAGPGVLL